MKKQILGEHWKASKISPTKLLSSIQAAQTARYLLLNPAVQKCSSNRGRDLLFKKTRRWARLAVTGFCHSMQTKKSAPNLRPASRLLNRVRVRRNSTLTP